MSEKTNLRAEYEELRERFSEMSADELKSGNWFASLARWVLEKYTTKVDADYIKRKYPGAGATNQAKKAIRLASKYASIVGGLSAAAVTALEVSIPASAGLDTALAVPAIIGSIAADVALTSRIQLRATYDLSVIHNAPLSLDDAEDCLFIFATALGVKLVESAGDVVKSVGPKVVAYNVRKLLRSGLRSGLQALLKKIGGTQLAKKLTERAAMRLLVPGISIPISASANYLFTRSYLKHANSHMARRGAVIQPLIRLYRVAPDLDRDMAAKALIAVMEAPHREKGWDEWQLQALRFTQSFACLDDMAIRALDEWFDRSPTELKSHFPRLRKEARSALCDYLVTAAAMGQASNDNKYVEAIEAITKLEARKVPSIKERRKMTTAS